MEKIIDTEQGLQPIKEDRERQRLMLKMIRPDKFKVLEEQDQPIVFPENFSRILEITSRARHHTEFVHRWISDKAIGWREECHKMVTLVAKFCHKWATPEVAEQLEQEEIVPRLHYLNLSYSDFMGLYRQVKTPAAKTFIEKRISLDFRKAFVDGQSFDALKNPFLLATLGVVKALHFSDLTLTEKTYPRFKKFLKDYLKPPIRALDLSGIKLPDGVSVSDLLPLCNGLESLTLSISNLRSIEDLTLVKNLRELTLLGYKDSWNGLQDVSFPVLPRLEKLHLKDWDFFPDCDALMRLRELTYEGQGKIPIPKIVALEVLEVIASPKRSINLFCEKDEFTASNLHTLRLVGCITESDNLIVNGASNLNTLTLQRSTMKVRLPDSHLVQRLSLVGTPLIPEMGFSNVSSLFLNSSSDQDILKSVPRLKTLKVYATSAKEWTLSALSKLERVTFQINTDVLPQINLSNLPNLWRVNSIKLRGSRSIR